MFADDIDIDGKILRHLAMPRLLALLRNVMNRCVATIIPAYQCTRTYAEYQLKCTDEFVFL
jgi:hypothetical protein